MCQEALITCNLYDHLGVLVFHGTCPVNARISVYPRFLVPCYSRLTSIGARVKYIQFLKAKGIN